MGVAFLARGDAASEKVRLVGKASVTPVYRWPFHCKEALEHTGAVFDICLDTEDMFILLYSCDWKVPNSRTVPAVASTPQLDRYFSTPVCREEFSSYAIRRYEIESNRVLIV